MADIDFDELDKAVNDLMANVDASKRPAGLDDPEENVVTISSSDTSPVVPQAAPPATVSSPASISAPLESTQTAEVVSSSAPPAARASGSRRSSCPTGR